MKLNTNIIIKGCETLKKLQRDVKGDYNMKEFMRGYDTTTQNELMEAVQKVLAERSKIVSNEIRVAVNE